MDNKTKLKLKRLAKSFNTICTEYKNALLDAIKNSLVTRLRVPLGKSLNVREIIYEGYFDVIGKYETPKNYPGNYILYGFGLDEKGNLSVESFDSDDSDCEWTFSEYDFSVSELNEILYLLESVMEGIEDGTFVVDEDFNVTEIEK